MSPRTATLPPSEPAMWRKLLARVHPDTNGDHELFIWTASLRESLCNCSSSGSSGYTPPQQPPPPREENPGTTSDAIDFETDVHFIDLTKEVLRVAEEVHAPYAYVLGLVEDCEYEPFGPVSRQQDRGATYKLLAAIGHAVGMSKAQRGRWYRIAEGIPLSRRHAGHILSKLKS